MRTRRAQVHSIWPRPASLALAHITGGAQLALHTGLAAQRRMCGAVCAGGARRAHIRRGRRGVCSWRARCARSEARGSCVSSVARAGLRRRGTQELVEAVCGAEVTPPSNPHILLVLSPPALLATPVTTVPCDAHAVLFVVTALGRVLIRPTRQACLHRRGCQVLRVLACRAQGARLTAHRIFVAAFSARRTRPRCWPRVPCVTQALRVRCGSTSTRERVGWTVPTCRPHAVAFELAVGTSHARGCVVCARVSCYARAS